MNLPLRIVAGVPLIDLPPRLPPPQRPDMPPHYEHIDAPWLPNMPPYLAQGRWAEDRVLARAEGLVLATGCFENPFASPLEVLYSHLRGGAPFSYRHAQARWADDCRPSASAFLGMDIVFESNNVLVVNVDRGRVRIGSATDLPFAARPEHRWAAPVIEVGGRRLVIDTGTTVSLLPPEFFRGLPRRRQQPASAITGYSVAFTTWYETCCQTVQIDGLGGVRAGNLAETVFFQAGPQPLGWREVEALFSHQSAAWPYHPEGILGLDALQSRALVLFPGRAPILLPSFAEEHPLYFVLGCIDALFPIGASRDEDFDVDDPYSLKAAFEWACRLYQEAPSAALRTARRHETAWFTRFPLHDLLSEAFTADPPLRSLWRREFGGMNEALDDLLGDR